jgi:hypothetical protein
MLVEGGMSWLLELWALQHEAAAEVVARAATCAVIKDALACLAE